MGWAEVFLVLALSHLAGDFLLQTEQQATHKFGGLRRGRTEARRALLAHVLTYTLCFVPALVWLASSLGWGVAWVAALIAIPHMIQDDGSLLSAYIRRIKHADTRPGAPVFILVDQSLHMLVLFGVALLVASAI